MTKTLEDNSNACTVPSNGKSATSTVHHDAGSGCGACSPASSRRWWMGVLASSIMAIPLGWLLSFGAALPAFLGLFFFTLFGLVIGSMAFRIAAPARPVARSSAFLGTALLVTLTLGISIVREALDFPHDMAEQAIGKTTNLGGQSPAEFRDAVARSIAQIVEKNHPPGGVIGYVRWVVTDGKIGKSESELLTKTLTVPYRGAWWIVRELLATALLVFGIGSQTWLLTRAALPPPESSKSIRV